MNGFSRLKHVDVYKLPDFVLFTQSWVNSFIHSINHQVSIEAQLLVQYVVWDMKMRGILILNFKSSQSIREESYINELTQRQNNVLTCTVVLCMSSEEGPISSSWGNKKYSFIYTSINLTLLLRDYCKIQIKRPLKFIYLIIQQIHMNRLGAALLQCLPSPVCLFSLLLSLIRTFILGFII